MEFSTDLKFRQTALSNNQNCIAWKKSYKNETGRIFKTHYLLREIAHSEAVLLLVAANIPFWPSCFSLLLQGEGTYQKNLNVITSSFSSSSRETQSCNGRKELSEQKALVCAFCPFIFISSKIAMQACNDVPTIVCLIFLLGTHVVFKYSGVPILRTWPVTAKKCAKSRQCPK